jgi:hypothetical protein
MEKFQNHKQYEIKNTPNSRFIGGSGDYVCEIDTQEISFEETKTILKSFNKSALGN